MSGKSSSPILLVSGASSHLGYRVIELLLEMGEKHIVAATRTPAKLADLAARGAMSAVQILTMRIVLPRRLRVLIECC